MPRAADSRQNCPDSKKTRPIINVPGDFGTIQAAIADPGTVAGDEIVVALGTYFENINFDGKAITVRSTDPNDAGVVLNTIINGGGSGTVVTCTSGEGANTVLSGFVITGGDATNGGGRPPISRKLPSPHRGSGTRRRTIAGLKGPEVPHVQLVKQLPRAHRSLLGRGTSRHFQSTTSPSPRNRCGPAVPVASYHSFLVKDRTCPMM